MSRRNKERERIRAKLSETDRKNLDALKASFRGCRMTGIRFSDGEQLGKLHDGKDKERS